MLDGVAKALANRVDSCVMSKKYEIVKGKIVSPGGGFIEAFRMAIVEMTCFGERRFDVSGYPYDTPSQALSNDWIVIGEDGRAAIEKVAHEAKDQDGATQQSTEVDTSTK